MSATLRVEQMPSGQVYGYVLPNVMRMRYSGFFPTSIIGLVDDWIGDPKVFGERRLSDQEALGWEEARARLVAWMIRTVGGEVAPVLDEDSKPRLDLGTFPPRVEVTVVSVGARTSLSWEEVVDPERFPMDDFTELFTRAVRAVAAPRAVPWDDADPR